MYLKASQRTYSVTLNTSFRLCLVPNKYLVKVADEIEVHPPEDADKTAITTEGYLPWIMRLVPNRVKLPEYRSHSGMLLPDHLDKYSFVAPAIEFSVEHPLPWSQIEPARGHWDNDLMVYQH